MRGGGDGEWVTRLFAFSRRENCFAFHSIIRHQFGNLSELRASDEGRGKRAEGKNKINYALICWKCFPAPSESTIILSTLNGILKSNFLFIDDVFLPPCLLRQREKQMGQILTDNSVFVWAEHLHKLWIRGQRHVMHHSTYSYSIIFYYSILTLSSSLILSCYRLVPLFIYFENTSELIDEGVWNKLAIYDIYFGGCATI